MKNTRFWVIGGVILVVVIAAIIFFVNQGNAASSEFQTTAAVRGDLLASIGATGTVRANQSAELVWQTTGKVESVNVVIGQQVSSGEMLATLDRTSVSQNIVLAESELLSAQRDLEDLRVSNQGRAEAELTLAQAEKALEDAQKKVDAIGFDRASETLIENKQAELDILNQRIAQTRQLYNSVASLPTGDSRKAEVTAQLTSLELQRDQLVAELNWYTGRPDDNEIAQRRANLEIARANLALAELRLSRLVDGVDPVDLAAAEARVAAAQATLNLARVSAPFSGTITRADPLPGDLVTAGAPAFRIDDLSRLLVDVSISEIDINDIREGQEVTLTFDAIFGKTYNGAIVQVGQVGSDSGGAVNFVVTVELTDADELVKPGMTAAVSITIRELEDVLLVPNRAVRFVDGQRVVYVLRNGELHALTITLGASSDTVSEVLTGELQEGDLIVLNPPTIFAPSGPGAGSGPGGGN